MKCGSLWLYVTVYSSPPSRGAWIEITVWLLTGADRIVAPLAGGVD